MSYTLTDIKVPEFSWDFEQNTSTATRVVRLEPWSAIDEAVADLAGGSLSAGSLMNITLPLKYPNKSYLWLLSVQAKPLFECVGEVGSDGIPTDPTGGELTLQYRSPRFEQSQKLGLTNDDGSFVTIDRNMSVEYCSEDAQGLYFDAQFGGGDPYINSGHSVTIDGEEFWYGGGLVPIDAKIGSSIAIADLRITWHRVSNPPWRAIQALQGLVNDRNFLDYSAEQVMFVGVSDRRQFNVDGTDIWQLTYQFSVRIPKYKRIDRDPGNFDKFLPPKLEMGGWNHFPRKGTTGHYVDPFWQKVYREPGTIDDPQQPEDLLYVRGNFDYLFQPDPDSNIGF